MPRHHYAVLGVDRSASPAEIRSAYNKLVLKAHPDKGGSHAQFIKIQEAWETLRDPEARAKYDKQNKGVFDFTDHFKQQQGEFSRAQNAPKHDFQGTQPGKQNGFKDSNKPKPNPWGDFRESAGGDAYNNFKGFHAGGSRHPPPRARNDHREEARRHVDRDHERARPGPRGPRPGDPKANQQPHDQAPQNQANADEGRDDRTPSPGEDETLPPMFDENQLKEVQDLAKRAERNLTRFKYHRLLLHKRIKVNELSVDLQIKIQYVFCYLGKREMEFRLRHSQMQNFNAELKAKKMPAPLESFFAVFHEAILAQDSDYTMDLSSLVTRVIIDKDKLERMESTCKANGRDLPKDDPLVHQSESSVKALDQLLTRILMNSPGVAYGKG